MRFFITGICGFVGSKLALHLLEQSPGATIVGLDNLARAGAHTNLPILRRAGVKVLHGDVRAASDLETVQPMDWIIDAAALPSVLAGVDGKSSSRQLVEHNLLGTINLLELARRVNAGLVLLSTSRVYSVQALSEIPVVARGARFDFDASASTPAGCSALGISESFSTASPLSLYGATKLASEVMALEYAHAFNLPVIINRCGVMAGAGQFGTAEQGIFSYWLASYAARKPLRYIGFDGTGRQVRDALHPNDVADLMLKQIASNTRAGIWNVGGGPEASMSLAELSDWAGARFGGHTVEPDLRPRRYDAPWIVMDSTIVRREFGWRPQISLETILHQLVDHQQANPDWLEMSAQN